MNKFKPGDVFEYNENGCLEFIISIEKDGIIAHAFDYNLVFIGESKLTKCQYDSPYFKKVTFHKIKKKKNE